MRPLFRRPLFTATALLVSGCGDPYAELRDPTDGVSTSAILAEGTPDSIGVLALLNHPATTLKVLDEDVPLEKRAAENLLARRNGADKAAGTADDKRFLSIAEVDAVAYVGPAALAALTDYARRADWVPAGADLLGAWDEVPFTVDQADLTLDLANNGEIDVLDDDVPLDVRAVESIVAARPIDTILELSGLYYVGPSALLHLRDFNSSPLPVGAPGSDCTMTADCNAGLLCTGMPSDEDGAPEIGKCVNTAELPGEETPCNATTPCGAGLVCAGTSSPWSNGSGYCRPEWMHGIFTSTQSMPIAEGAPTKSSVVVYGLATVPEDVWLTLDIDHPRPQDLIVRVYHPNGSNGVVFNHSANPEIKVPVHGGVEYDAYVNGTWTCEVIDTVTGQQGGLKGFTLELNSRWD